MNELVRVCVHVRTLVCVCVLEAERDGEKEGEISPPLMSSRHGRSLLDCFFLLRAEEGKLLPHTGSAAGLQQGPSALRFGPFPCSPVSGR